MAMGAPRRPCRRHGNAAGGRAHAQVGPACRCQSGWVPGGGGTFGSSRHPRDSALPHQPQGRKGKSLERETSVTQASLPRSAPHSIEPTWGRRNLLSGSPVEVRDVGHAPNAADIPHTPHPDPNRGRTTKRASTRMCGQVGTTEDPALTTDRTGYVWPPPEGGQTSRSDTTQTRLQLRSRYPNLLMNRVKQLPPCDSIPKTGGTVVLSRRTRRDTGLRICPAAATPGHSLEPSGRQLGAGSVSSLGWCLPVLSPVVAGEPAEVRNPTRRRSRSDRLIRVREDHRSCPVQPQHPDHG